jgi:Antibiotic biosynthesis monooxygenase.
MNKTASYRAIVHFHFKKGLEEEGIILLQKELIEKASQLGCHSIELLQDEMNPTYIVGIAEWASIEEARTFQQRWSKKEEQIIRMCTNAPQREFYRVRTTSTERGRKAA